MPANRFDATIRERAGVAVIDLHGDINADAGAALDRVYRDALATSPSAIVLSFADVDYINSTGIALIVGLLARARAAEMPVRAYALAEHYREIFTITRLSDFMTLYPDEVTATGATPAAAG